jgi:hypothetical protein
VAAPMMIEDVVGYDLGVCEMGWLVAGGGGDDSNQI